ncbi:MAG: hypothetical protein R3F56_03065 [Planctomycetota bacterium]
MLAALGLATVAWSTATLLDLRDGEGVAPTASAATPAAASAESTRGYREAVEDPMHARGGVKGPGGDAAAPAAAGMRAGQRVVRVVDESGAPVAGALVAWLAHGPEAEERLRKHAGKSPAGPGRRQSLVIAAGAHMTTDHSGTTTVPSAPDVLDIAAEDGARWGDAVVQPGDQGPIVIVLRSGGRLRVDVLDPGGAPIAGREVALFWLRDAEEPAATTPLGRTEGDGSLVVESRARWIEALTQHRGRVASARFVPDIPGGQTLGTPARLDDWTTTRVELRLPRLAAMAVSFAGRTASPASGCVWIAAEGDLGPSWCRPVADTCATPVIVAPGLRYRLRFEGDGEEAAATADVPLAPDGVVRVTLVPQCAESHVELRGRLRRADRPYDGPLRLELLAGSPADPEPSVLRAFEANADGGSVVIRVPAAELNGEWVRVLADDATAEIPLPKPVAGKAYLGTLLLRPRALVASVTVRGEAGRILDEATLAVGGPLVGRAHVQRRAPGEFAVLGDPTVRAGTVRASAPEHLPEVVDVGACASTDVQLRPAARVAVRFALPEGVQTSDLLAALEEREVVAPRPWWPDPGPDAAARDVLRWSRVPRAHLRLRLSTAYPPASIALAPDVPADPAGWQEECAVDVSRLLRVVHVTFVDAAGAPMPPAGWLGAWQDVASSPLHVIELTESRWVLPVDITRCVMLRSGFAPRLVDLPAGERCTVLWPVGERGLDLTAYGARSVHVWRRGERHPGQRTSLAEFAATVGALPPGRRAPK